MMTCKKLEIQQEELLEKEVQILREKLKKQILVNAIGMFAKSYLLSTYLLQATPANHSNTYIKTQERYTTVLANYITSASFCAEAGN